MDNGKFVSIIVPVYNGQTHIGKCIASLLNQTYINIEIIVVNDGSTDKTKEIISEWAAKHKRVVVINKENEGVSVARNIGLKVAKGDYILFVDSDDNLKVSAVEELIAQVNESFCDMVLFGFSVRGDINRKNDTAALEGLALFASDEVKMKIIKSLISTRDNIYGYIWRAMYYRKMLTENNVVFPSGIKISEDYMFLLNAVSCASNVLVVTDEYYIYNLGEASMSKKYIPTLLQDMNYVNKWMLENIVCNNEELLLGYYCCVSNTYLRYVQNTMRNEKSSFFMKINEISGNKHKYGFQKFIRQVWNKPRSFDLKSLLAMFLFRFHLDCVYGLLFEIKEKAKGEK